MRKSLFRIIFLLSIISSVIACVSIEKIRTGEQALERKQYALAQTLLLKDIETSQGSAKAKKAFLLGIAFEKTNQFDNALQWYLKSEKYGGTNPQLIWNIGRMSKNTGAYEQAIDYFTKIEDSKNIEIAALASREKDICKQIIIWDTRGTDMGVEKLDIRDDGSMYFSHINFDGKLIVTSDHKNMRTDKNYKWTGRYFTDIYEFNPDQSGEIEPLPNWKHKNFHQGSPSFNSDNTEIIFTICSNEDYAENYCKLYSSKLVEDRWQEANPLNFIKPGINYSHPFLNRDSILFFACDDPSGAGGYDLYFSTRTKTGWRNPILLPGNINSSGNEKFPTISGDSLYFSSDYFPGYGGLDVFKVYILPNGQWSPPYNLKAPVNSPYDDFGIQYIFNDKSDLIAYFNSNREEPQGFDKIFKLKKLKATNSEENPSKEALVSDKKYTLFLSLKIVEKVFEDPNNPNSRVIGKKPIANVSGEFENSKKFESRQDGRYITELSFDSSYTIKLIKNGFLQSTITIPPTAYPSANDNMDRPTISIEAELVRPYYDKEIVLQNIYYDLDKWNIREDARPTLDILVNLLDSNTDLKVLIGAHTDCRADEEYNLNLSQKRAAAVVEYLKQKGIAPQRLKFKGYGKSKLIEDCICSDCTEKQHQKNRRTTFVLSK